MSPTSSTPNNKLTIVLVHGAFADASGWAGVIERLQARGVQVTAPVNPLRGVSIDSAYMASYLNQIPGPVLAVAHSYGGVVITNAASMAKNVVGLVYVCAFAPDEGERLGEAAPTSKDSILYPFLVPNKYPTGQGDATALEFSINPAGFHEAFAADLPQEQTVIMAASQRPLSELAFSEPNGTPAWKTLPSWAIVGTGDKTIGTDLVRSMAKRSGATIVEVESSHVAMISQPQIVTDVILTAVATVS